MLVWESVPKYSRPISPIRFDPSKLLDQQLQSLAPIAPETVAKVRSVLGTLWLNPNAMVGLMTNLKVVRVTLRNQILWVKWGDYFMAGSLPKKRKYMNCSFVFIINGIVIIDDAALKCYHCSILWMYMYLYPLPG